MSLGPRSTTGRGQMSLGPKSTTGRGHQLREIAATAEIAQWHIGATASIPVKRRLTIFE
jgi:hypothetical protein